MTISYVLNNSLYLNITNACPNACDFCVRNNFDSVGDAENLWLKNEPSSEEIFNDLSKRNFDDYNEVVFCGYGEPFERIDEVVLICKWIKAKSNIKIRINTNGLGDLIHSKPTAPLIEGLVDTLSISLNASIPKKYDDICHSIFGLLALPAIINFAENAKNYVKTVIFSVVDTLTEEELEECRLIAERCGVKFRIRSFIG
jgi:radical SAM protein, TatD family-associated